MLGERLKSIRKQKGLSQQALATRLGTASGYISEIEKGKTMPGSAFLCSLKREFPEVDLNWLLTGEERAIVAETPAAYEPMDIVTKKILEMLEGMDEEKRREVLKYAEEKKLVMQCLALLEGNKKR